MTESIFETVKADLDRRDCLGRRQYGGPLMAHDGRNSLQDAYEEVLDLAVYLRKAIAELENFIVGSQVPEVHRKPDLFRDLTEAFGDVRHD